MKQEMNQVVGAHDARTVAESAAAHTPVPWAVLKCFPEYIVRAEEAEKRAGYSDDPSDDMARYARPIAYVEVTRQSPGRHLHRVVSPAIARANAELIVRAVNNHKALVDALRALVQSYDAASKGSELWALESQFEHGRTVLAALDRA